jgi:hypothetical protein
MKANSACRCLVAIVISLFATAATSGVAKSFFFAETLKYLLRSPGTPNTINPKNRARYGEAHSLRRTWEPPNRWPSTAAGWSSVS